MNLCFNSYCITWPFWILAAIALIPIIIWSARHTFVKFGSRKEKEEYEKSRKQMRLILMVTRSIIVIALFIAIATPYTEKQVTVKGAPKLTILTDNSTSFNMFDTATADKLVAELAGRIPVNVKTIAYGDRSALGDGILNNMEGGDNLLLISDGQNTFGRDLGDVVLFATTLNTTISTLSISTVQNDASVSIEGPHEVIVGTDNDYMVEVNNIGNVPYRLDVEVDGRPLLSEANTESKIITYRFTEGTHVIHALITADDYFKENNRFYKTIKVVPRPKVLLVSEESSSLQDALSRIYDIEKLGQLPSDLSPYAAIVIDDVQGSSLEGKTDALSSYVAEGRGMLAVGGEGSYDKGSYKNSAFETLLPVGVGWGKKKSGEDINIVVLIDISGSTGAGFGGSSESTKIEVEKALAIRIIQDMAVNDNVAVVAFNSIPYLVSPLTQLGLKQNLTSRIASLQNGGGTVVVQGLNRADTILEDAKGSRNVIVISDGHTEYAQDAWSKASLMSEKGIKTYTVGVGKNTNSEFMRKLAELGGGVYFEPAESQYLKILFGEPEEEKAFEGRTGLTILDNNHFITHNTKLNAEITGMNFVVPKPAARTLVITNIGDPILAVWRYGLGRVASLTTDNGKQWSGPLYGKGNSEIVIRTLNWLIGDLSKIQHYDVDAQDTFLGEPVTVNVIADHVPEWEGLLFSKVDTNAYTATFLPEESGVIDILKTKVAVNYRREYKELGMNPEMESLAQLSGGKVFGPNDIEQIISTVESLSKRSKQSIVNLRWPFVLIAMLMFLLEIGIRRFNENRLI